MMLYCISRSIRKQLLSQERELQSRLNTGCQSTSSPIVISSQESISSISSPTTVYPTTSTSSGAFPSLHDGNSSSKSLGDGHSWRGWLDSSERTPLERQGYGKECFDDAGEIMSPLEEEEFMEEDFENFDDFQEEPSPQELASGTPDPPFSAIHPARPTFDQASTRTTVPCATAYSTQSAATGTRGSSLTATSARNVLPLKPASSSGGGGGGGNGGCKDNSSEFRGPYNHTKEMFKVFTQVRCWYSAVLY